jgi:hypothetical protein
MRSLLVASIAWVAQDLPFPGVLARIDVWCDSNGNGNPNLAIVERAETIGAEVFSEEVSRLSRQPSFFLSTLSAWGLHHSWGRTASTGNADAYLVRLAADPVTLGALCRHCGHGGSLSAPSHPTSSLDFVAELFDVRL